jgi:isopenicillin N synthase-like dioxygenase
VIDEPRQTETTIASTSGAARRIEFRDLLGDTRSRDRGARAVLDAFHRDGYFCVDGILGRSDTHARLLAAMREFFALPDSDLRKRAIDVTGQPDTRGWMPLYGEPAYEPGTLARVESFDCGRPHREGDGAARPGNRWPDVPGFRGIVEEAWNELTVAGMAILEAIGHGLGPDPGFLVNRCSSQDLSTMRLLHYPGQRPGSAANDPANVGISAHTDFECITLISQTAPGLELRDPDGNWHDAPVGTDSIVVLAGDMLERWTNGAIRATGHRVRSATEQRFSVVLFFAVDDGVTISPAGLYMVAGDAPRYAPITQAEHSRARLGAAEMNRDEYARTRGSPG